jgi:hypothetical protein
MKIPKTKHQIAYQSDVDLTFREQLASDIFTEIIEASVYTDIENLNLQAEIAVQAADSLIEALARKHY